MRKAITLVLTLLLVTACTRWPKPSTGGYAEYYLYTPPYQKTLTQNSPCLVFLSNRLLILLKKTDAMRHSHAAKCYPARVLLLDNLAQRIAQEIAAGLLIGVEADLYLYQANLNDLYKLNKLKGCPRPKPTRHWKKLESRLQ